MTTENYVGIVAGVFTSVSMLPQLIKMFRQKKAENVSVVMLLLLFSGLAAWVVYGCMIMNYPIIVTNAFSLLVNIMMLVLRIKYKNAERGMRSA